MEMMQQIKKLMAGKKSVAWWYPRRPRNSRGKLAQFFRSSPNPSSSLAENIAAGATDAASAFAAFNTVAAGGTVAAGATVAGGASVAAEDGRLRQ